jgi:hypothetical protein
MHERRGLKSLSHPLVGHSDSGQLAQLFIDQREQLGGSLWHPRLNGAEQLGDVGHWDDDRPLVAKSE